MKCGGSLGCFPVSRDGVLLPPDHFSSTDTRKYLNAKLGNFGPIGAVGSKYGYTAVTEAAGIAALLKDVWKKTRVKCIAIQGSSVSEPQVYVLLPAANGIEVIWGHAPGSENEGEATASEKVKRLAEFARHNREETTFLPLPTTTLDLRPANGALLRDGTE